MQGDRGAVPFGFGASRSPPYQPEADVWPGHRTRDRHHGASRRTACYAALIIWSDDFVDISVGAAEMLPCAPAGSLRLRVEELGSGRGHRGVNLRERVDSEPDHRCTPEEVVVLVPWTVDVHLGAVSQPEPCR